MFQAHPGPGEPEAHLEQTSRQRPGHQEDPRREPGGALQAALQVPGGGTEEPRKVLLVFIETGASVRV